MEIPIHHVDAFVTDGVFTGNPAAVCPLREWLPDRVLQQIAAENNLSETAFFVGGNGRYDIRWMTPAAEIDLCGHATLASAHVVFAKLEPGRKEVRFDSQSGPLHVRAEGETLVLDFPSRPPERVPADPAIGRALGREPVELLAARDYMAVFPGADDVRALAPDMGLLRKLDKKAVIVTAPGTGDVDFVSRFFAPGLRHRRGPRHRLRAHEPHPVLGEAARQVAAPRPAASPPRGRAALRGPGRARGHRRPCRAVSRGRDPDLSPRAPPGGRSRAQWKLALDRRRPGRQEGGGPA